MKEVFRKISNRVSAVAGSAGAFLGAVLIVFIWAVTGPAFGFSNTWQLVINTGTTIVTFLMVFLIQNTQNRDSKAMQLKLDELIRTHKPARNSFMDLEDLTDEDLDIIDTEFKHLHEQHAAHPVPAMHKLHAKIAAEHTRRQKMQTGISNMADRVGDLFSNK
ncbi:MAG: putative small integral rane protein [Candidatus Saccharibacteria bacterium]|nr:putative small integral rane protein [Candidatus Saccharibacteria bacterium]